MTSPPSSSPSTPLLPLHPPLVQDSIGRGSTTANAGEVSPASRLFHTSSASRVFSNLTTSASSLLTPLAHRDSTSVHATLASFSTSSGKVQSPSTTPSSSSSVFSDTSRPALSHASSAATSAGFKSQPPSDPSSDTEFTFFSTRCTVPTCQNFNHPQSQRSVTSEGQVVIDLSTQPLRPLGLLPSNLSRVDVSHPLVTGFVACDDPVDFLSNTSEYSEEVWGDLAGLFRQATEVKGKTKESQPSTTTNKLSGVWGYPGSSKL